MTFIAIVLLSLTQASCASGPSESGRLNSNLTHRKRVITPEECKAIGAFARVGANPNQRSPDGLTPYEIALCDGHRELAEVLSLAATR